MGDLSQPEIPVTSAQDRPHSPAASQRTEDTVQFSSHITGVEHFYQGISASYQKLTDMYSQLKRDKELEVEGWKMYFEGISASYARLTTMHAALTTDYLLQKEEIAKLQEAASVSHTPSFHIAPTEPQQPVLHTETTSKVPIQSPKSQKTSPKTSASPINKAFKFKKHQSPEQIRPSDKHLSKDNVDAYRHYELEVEELNRRCGDLQRELNKANKELGRQEEMRRKKEEQVAGLVDTLKQRDLEISRLTKDVRRKEETVKSMTVEMQLVAGKVERDTKAKIQKEMESMRQLVITKEEETRRNRHFLRSHNQDAQIRKNVRSPLITTSKSTQSSRQSSAKRGTDAANSLNSTLPAKQPSQRSDFSALPSLDEQISEASETSYYRKNRKLSGIYS